MIFDSSIVIWVCRGGGVTVGVVVSWVWVMCGGGGGGGGVMGFRVRVWIFFMGFVGLDFCV